MSTVGAAEKKHLKLKAVSGTELVAGVARLCVMLDVSARIAAP
jgi:hypothetical protein